jgi:hypothetical protein
MAGIRGRTSRARIMSNVSMLVLPARTQSLVGWNGSDVKLADSVPDTQHQIHWHSMM